MKFGILLSATFADAAKILCLHGGGGNSQSMRSLMGDFESALPEFDFVYAQTPESGGVWIVDPPGKDEPTTDPHWADNSFNYLDNLIASQGPFYALCGYSQGSAIIPVYLAHRGGGSGVTSTQGPASSTTNGGNQSTTKPTDSTTTKGGNGNNCSGDKDWQCASSDDCWGSPCCDDGFCNFDGKDRSTGSDFNRVVLFNGYVPSTHLGLVGLLDSAAPLTTPAFVFSGGQDPFGPMAPEQASKFSNVIHRESANVGHVPPSPADPNFQQVVNFIRAGLTDTTTQGTGGTSSQTTTQTTDDTTTKTTADPLANCPEKGTLVSWKGAAVSKVMYYSETGAMLKVNFFNNAAGYDVVADRYLGFLGYPRKQCGPDFIDALVEGRVSWKIYDYGPFYTEQFMYNRVDGRHTSAMMQFYRHTFGEDRDLPGVTKKDQIYIVFEGLDQVNFGAKDMLTCLEKVQAGTMHVANNNEAAVNWAPCAAWDKDLGW